jgi:predicted nucleotidyltransferase
MNKSGLTYEDIKRIKSVFSKYTQIEKVVIYGSRAMGNYKPASDIDLTLIGSNIDTRLQHKIEFDLDDLMLPYKFDISVYHRIKNPDFLDHIRRVGREFYVRGSAIRHE